MSYLSDSSGIYILGDTFLRNFVSTFNFKEGIIYTGVNIYAPEGTAISSPLGLFSAISNSV